MTKRIKKYPINKYPMIDNFIPKAEMEADKKLKIAISESKFNNKEILYTKTINPQAYIIKKGIHGEYIQYIRDVFFIEAMNRLTIKAGVRVEL
tara:strand:+ start:63 stop:341 length:279 start_codon:yes stop_codon:yes gene_type:complete